MLENEIKLTDRERKIAKRRNTIKKHSKEIGEIYMNSWLKRNQGDKKNAS